MHLVKVLQEAAAWGHIVYEQAYPQAPELYVAGMYFIEVILPPFFFGIKRMWVLGAAIVLSYLISPAFYKDYLVPVWCFFAAMMSVSVLAIFV